MTRYFDIQGAACCAALVLLTLSGCNRSDAGGEQSAAASASAPPAASSQARSGMPLPQESVLKVVNPKQEAPYSGPTGAVRGTITVSGDRAPERDEVLSKIPANCPRAKATYGPLFREGMLRSLADVLVTVTGYSGYVPESREAHQVEAYGCAFGQRTIGLTFGQRLEVSSKDDTYMPALIGSRMPAQVLALANKSPVPFYPHRPGRYVLTDSVKQFMRAEVLVLKYPTHTVTGLDGKYQISGIPVGEATLTAFLPYIMKSVEKKVRIEKGKTLEVDLEITFDEKQLEASFSPVDGGARAATSPSAAKSSDP